jgi:hypothetical protein
MKKTLLLLVITTMIYSCKKNDDPQPQTKGDPVAGIKNMFAYKISPAEGGFSIALFVVDGNSSPYTSLTTSNFKINDFTSTTGNQISFSNLTYKAGTLPLSQVDYSAFLLMDQSTSIAGTDPQNQRITAGREFCSHLGSNDYVALGKFNGPASVGCMTILNSFTHNGSGLTNNLNGLQNNLEPNTPLYNSIYDAMNYTQNYAQTGTHKAVVVFTDGMDTENDKDISDLSHLYKKNGVQVFTVGLSNQVDYFALCDIANNCGGGLIYAANARQLISAYGYLGNVLSNTAKIYYLNGIIQTSGSFSNGSTVSTFVNITLPDGAKMSLPVKFQF